MWRRANQIEDKEVERMRVGLGKRLTMLEMINLHKEVQKQAVAQMGMRWVHVQQQTDSDAKNRD